MCYYSKNHSNAKCCIPAETKVEQIFQAKFLRKWQKRSTV